MGASRSERGIVPSTQRSAKRKALVKSEVDLLLFTNPYLPQQDQQQVREHRSSARPTEPMLREHSGADIPDKMRRDLAIEDTLDTWLGTISEKTVHASGSTCT